MALLSLILWSRRMFILIERLILIQRFILIKRFISIKICYIAKIFCGVRDVISLRYAI